MCTRFIKEENKEHEEENDQKEKEEWKKMRRFN